MGRKLSPNIDLAFNMKVFSFLQKEFNIFITTDQTLIDAISGLRGKVSDSDIDLFIENSQSIGGHHDHFHIGFRCPSNQPDCRSDWDEWDRIRRAGKKWEYTYGM